jgi:hypothetical protein
LWDAQIPGPGRRRARDDRAESGRAENTPAKVRLAAETARRRFWGPDGGYRCDHCRALAQRVKVADGVVRIMGSQGISQRTLSAGGSVKSVAGGVPSFVPSWRMGWDSNPRYAHTYGGFQDRCLKPLGHPSRAEAVIQVTARRQNSTEPAALSKRLNALTACNHWTHTTLMCWLPPSAPMRYRVHEAEQLLPPGSLE